MIYLRDFYFPSMPEQIQVSTGANYQNYSLLQGKTAIPNGTDIKKVKWSGTFFGRKRRRTAVVERWIEPGECIAFLERSLKTGDTLNLIVEEAPINLDVTIAALSYTAAGAFGDIQYNIELQEAQSLKIYTTSELNIQPLAKTVETRPDDTSRGSGQAYVVKKGDSLWKIARAFYGGSGAGWQKIYNANATVIEKTAKGRGKPSSDHGHWIYPGTTLTIP